MKTRFGKIWWMVVLFSILAAAFFAFTLFDPGKNIQQAVEKTRRQLREQGFKTDLADFNFFTDDESRVRETSLTALNMPLEFDASGEHLDIFQFVTNGAAIVIWKQGELKFGSSTMEWGDVRAILNENQSALDAACEAALAGPIQFNLDASRGGGLPLPHLAALRNLSSALTVRTLLELHDGNKNFAWTNLLAETRLVTAWKPEPAEISHLVRFRLEKSAFDVTWQALQNSNCPEKNLAALQREWESVDFFTNLPETVAFRRASLVAVCEQLRKEPLAGIISPRFLLKQALESPQTAFSQLKHNWDEIRYRSEGTYADEIALMNFFQQRETEFRKAIQAPTWTEMRALPGVTNFVAFTSAYPSRLQTIIHFRNQQRRFQHQNGSFLAHAAEAEVRRRILVTAIALERYREKNGGYPTTLKNLMPEFLKAVPTDFMDGQPLRYERTNDDRFMLYSVGLDCVDDGGKLSSFDPSDFLPGISSVPPNGDIVWPLPAISAAP